MHERQPVPPVHGEAVGRSQIGFDCCGSRQCRLGRISSLHRPTCVTGDGSSGGILELVPTSHVADVGAGDGAFSLELASRIVTRGDERVPEVQNRFRTGSDKVQGSRGSGASSKTRNP